jgi:hypothetical protein
MRFSILTDADVETGLHDIGDEMNRPPMDGFFTNRFYDDTGLKITIILMGRDPRWNFKQRIRFSKKENKLYIDLIFDWNTIVCADDRTRKTIVAEKFVTEVPHTVAKYKLNNFDLPRFAQDLREWFEINDWIEREFSEVFNIEQTT